MDLYKEQIIDHYKNPRNFGELNPHHHHSYERNPLCGDEVELFILVEDGKVKDVRFKGEGCAISIASSSMLTEYIKGKQLSDIVQLSGEDIFELLGTRVAPARLKCAFLPLEALKKALVEKNL